MRTLREVYDDESFMLVSPKITILKESANFTLSAGRKIYTGKTPLSFVSLSGTGIGNVITLPAYQVHAFSDAFGARITG